MKYKRLLDVSTVIFPLEALLFPPRDNTLRHRSFSRHFRQGEVVVFEVEEAGGGDVGEGGGVQELGHTGGLLWWCCVLLSLFYNLTEGTLANWKTYESAAAPGVSVATFYLSYFVLRSETRFFP